MRQNIFGGGASILDKAHDVNNPKVFQKFNLNYFITCSQERLLRAKRGEDILKIARSQQGKYQHLVKTLRSAHKLTPDKSRSLVYLKKQENLTERKTYKNSLYSANINRVLHYSSSKISPNKQKKKNSSNEMSEAEKLANLSEFFKVIFIQEKFAAIGNELNEPVLRSSLEAQRKNFREKVKGLARRNSFRVVSDGRKFKSDECKKFLTSTERKIIEVDREIQEDLNNTKIVEIKGDSCFDDYGEIGLGKRRYKAESKIKDLMAVDPRYLVVYKKKNKDQKALSGCKSYSNVFKYSENSSGNRSITNRAPLIGCNINERYIKNLIRNCRTIQKNISESFKNKVVSPDLNL